MIKRGKIKSLSLILLALFILFNQYFRSIKNKINPLFSHAELCKGERRVPKVKEQIFRFKSVLQAKNLADIKLRSNLWRSKAQIEYACGESDYKKNYKNLINYHKINNNKIINKTIISFLILLFIINITLAVPNTLTLQGKLTNIGGSSLHGTYDMSFRIYSVPEYELYNVTENVSILNQTSGGYYNIAANITYINYTNMLYEKNLSVRTDVNGVYDIILKDVNLNFSDEYYLGIIVGDDNESVPRVNLTSSPYAFRSNISEDLNPENWYIVSVFNITGNLTVGDSGIDKVTIVSDKFNVSEGNLGIEGNVTLGEKITFGLGGVIDNIVNGWLKLSGNLNVTEGLRVEKNISLGYENATIEIVSDRFNVSNGTVRVGGNLSVASALYVDSSSGMVGIGTVIPGLPLTVIGNVSISGNLSVGGNLSVDGSTLFVDAESDRVGIGTTSPNFKLDVAGSINASGLNITGNALIKGDVNITGRLDVGTLNISGVTFSQGDLDVSGDLRVDGGAIIKSGMNVSGGDVNLSGALFVDESAGRVGIGTTAPSQKLVVVGGTNITGGLNVSGDFSVNQQLNITAETGEIKAAGNLTLRDKIKFRLGEVIDNVVDSFLTITGGLNVTESLIVKGGANITGDFSVNQQLNITASSGDLVTAGTIGVSGTENSYILGNVGIGKISPATELDVDGGINASTLNISGNTYLATQSGNVGIGTTSPSERLTVTGNVSLQGNTSIGMNTLFVDNTSGNVGIGTTSPQAALHINETTGGTEIRFSAGNYADYWEIGQDSVGFHFQYDGTSVINMFDSGGLAVGSNYVSTDPGAGAMTIEGNVGIGTTVPGYKLDVNGTVAIRSTPGTVLKFIDDNYASDTVYANLTYDGSSGNGWVFDQTVADGYYKFRGAGTDLVTIDQSTGNVGIGTTAPAKTLESVGDVYFNLSTDDKDFEIVNGSGTSIFFVNGSSKKVGIGQTSPNVTLGVSGDANITGDLEVVGNTILGRDISDTVTVNAVVASHLIPSDNAKDLGSGSNYWRTLYVDWANINNLTAGNVTIGGVRGPSFTIYTNNTGDDADYVSLIFERGTPTVNAVFKWDAGSKRFDMNFPLNIQSNNNLTVDTDTLFVDGSIDKVGIGTTSPGQELEVSGNVNVTGTLWANTLNITGVTFMGGNLEVKNLTVDNYIKTPGDTLLNITPGGNLSVDDVLFVDRENDRVGIGKTNPTEELDVNGDINMSSSNPVLYMTDPVIIKNGNDIVISD